MELEEEEEGAPLAYLRPFGCPVFQHSVLLCVMKCERGLVGKEKNNKKKKNEDRGFFFSWRPRRENGGTGRGGEGGERRREPPNQLEVSEWTLPGGPGGEVTEGGLVVSCQLLACNEHKEHTGFCVRKGFYN